jgi:uncharacterized OsmC-like protein
MTPMLAPTPLVIVEGNGCEFAQHITAGVHKAVADESVPAGGRDAGPSPYQLLLAALGSCTSMTVGLYARRKQWPLTRVRVELSHSKTWARDSARWTPNQGPIDCITRLIKLDGPLTADQRERLLQIANKCPVHRMLLSEIEIVSTLDDYESDGIDAPGRKAQEPCAASGL